jgi:hypothetical protein
MDKSGYDKIKFCGEQSKHDNLQYFWADTCCIDKSDSVELQEAINSMFRSYQNAAKCYVYLADVSCPPSDAKIEVSPIPWEAAFCKSRWFSGLDSARVSRPHMCRIFLSGRDSPRR